jgi:Protein of unknown function (DUF2934)
MDQTLTHRIRERAYHIWMETGGHADQNWLRAETEILRTAAPMAPREPSSKKQSRKSDRRQQVTASVL